MERIDELEKGPMGARRGRWFRTYLETKTWIWTGDRGEIEVDEGETRKKDSWQESAIERNWEDRQHQAEERKVKG